MSPNPEVSVVLPARDALDTLPEAVASIRAQEGVAWELVVVDDGSRDGTADWLTAEADRDARVRPVRRPREGLVPALEAGLAAARAPLVARMDADDVSLPGRLARQAQWLDAHPDVAAVGCLVRCFPDDAVQEGMRHYEAWQNSLLEPEEIAREMFVEAPLVHPSVMFRAAVVRAVGGYRQRGWPEDYDLWLRLYAAGQRLAKVPETLFLWRERPARLTRTHADYRPERHMALKAHFLARTVLGECGKAQIWGAGRDGKRLRRALAAEGVEVIRYFDVDPRKVGGRVDDTVPVHHWTELADYLAVPTLVAVGTRGAREEIRAAFEKIGVREGHDAWFVA